MANGLDTHCRDHVALLWPLVIIMYTEYHCMYSWLQFTDTHTHLQILSKNPLGFNGLQPYTPQGPWPKMGSLRKRRPKQNNTAKPP